MTARRACGAMGNTGHHATGSSMRRARAALVRAAIVALALLPIPPGFAADTADTARPRAIALDRATIDRILALDPDHLSAEDVRDVLAHAPAPRIIALQGSVAVVTMAPFAEFLMAMGYPADRLANPRDGALSYDSYGSSATLAGTLAWYYERDGMMPMLIGHSQGGMLALKTLHELAGAFATSIPVWNPLTDTAEPRTTVVDPLTGRERPVLGLKVAYAAALATGALPRVLLGQWAMLPRLRRVPDTVEEFTGFTIPWDPIAGTIGNGEPYAATGTAVVHNVVLPASYSHIGLPQMRHLATDAVTRAWIDRFTPDGAPAPLPEGTGVDTTNLVHAAVLWYSIKKHWCREAQRLLRAHALSS
jgi:hypothetical protein